MRVFEEAPAAVNKERVLGLRSEFLREISIRVFSIFIFWRQGWVLFCGGRFVITHRDTGLIAT